MPPRRGLCPRPPRKPLPDPKRVMRARPRHIKVDLAGQRFGLLTAIEPVAATNARATVWRWRCDCGGERRCTRYVLTKASHCGCLTKRWIKHGHARKTTGQSKEYRAWYSMRRRCLDPRNPFFDDYGGRGISICDEWITSFVAFLRDVGLAPSPQHSLDRIDVDGDYTPANVRWATPLQQSRNRRNTAWAEAAE